MKFSLTRVEKKIFRATAKQTGGSGGGNSHSLEYRCELREETEQRIGLNCDFSLFPKGIIARIWKAVKNLLLRLLIVIVFCQASPPTRPSPHGAGESSAVPLKIRAPGFADHKPDKLETYHKLTAAINQAKDNGDIETGLLVRKR